MLRNEDRFWIKRSNGNWSHCSPIKVIINPILRILQFYTDQPYVIVSIVNLCESSHPRFIRYYFSNKC